MGQVWMRKKSNLGRGLWDWSGHKKKKKKASEEHSLAQVGLPGTRKNRCQQRGSASGQHTVSEPVWALTGRGTGQSGGGYINMQLTANYSSVFSECSTSLDKLRPISRWMAWTNVLQIPVYRHVVKAYWSS